jgi:hypothetical protein
LITLGSIKRNANSDYVLGEDDFFNEDDILQLAQHYVDPVHYDNPLDEEEEEEEEDTDE